MFDFSLSLRENAHLLALLSYYAQVGSDGQSTWLARRMQMDGIDSKQLTSLHGDLIAFNGIEPNTGQAIAFQDGTHSACYRITLNGLRAYRRIHGIEVADELTETPEQSQPRVSRKKKKKEDSLAVAPLE
jgi:hypothetical protein